MIKLVPPKEDGVLVLDEIISSKKSSYRNKMIRLQRDKIVSRYREYIKVLPRLENLAIHDFGGRRKQAMIGLYASRTAALNKLRSRLLNCPGIYSDLCPYCGIGEPDTLDHYLPKAVFPEYSVFPHNLLPMCGSCNSNYKGSEWLDKGKRKFIHCYYDDIPQEKFLHAIVTCNGALGFDFLIGDIPGKEDVCSLIRNHFNGLSLASRFFRKARSEVRRKSASLSRYHNLGGTAAVRNALRSTASEHLTQFGPNYWSSALYEALANSNCFCSGGFQLAEV